MYFPFKSVYFLQQQLSHTGRSMRQIAGYVAKWHFSSAEALPSSKFRKSENGPISWTEWNIMMKFCIHIDIDMM